MNPTPFGGNDRPGPNLSQLAAYADGELPERDRARVEAWLCSHPEARAEVEEVRDLDQLFGQVAPTDPSPLAWDDALERIHAALPPGGALDPAGPRRVGWPVRFLLAVAATAAMVGGLLLARPYFLPNQGPPAPGPAPGDLAHVEPFPVVSLTELEVLSIDVRDADALAVGRRLFGSFTVAEASDIEVLEAEPAEEDGPAPRLGGGTIPMIVLSSASPVPE